LRPIAAILSIGNVVLFGLEVTPRCRIGEGLLLPHTSGTVIGAATIGCNVTIFQGVTLGAKEADLAFDSLKRPTIGSNVVVGAGAKVLGGIRVGDGAIIAANSVVIDDVRDKAVVMGIPAIERRVQQ
jgi:serine O-acetyltransferase